MSILNKIFARLLSLIQFILVVIFIVFEEIVWENFARPIYNFIQDLQILQLLEKKLKKTNRYFILLLFVMLFVVAEATGIVAGVIFVKGMVTLAIFLYVLRIPIVAFTFWLFRVTEDKLLSFGWLKYLYLKILDIFEWVKSRDTYISMLSTARDFKIKVKIFTKEFRQKYISGDSPIAKRFAKTYTQLKKIIQREA
ncbi:MAG: hypothetical protein HF962_04470 [Sulfurovum sp.]|nr:hypothetical protein [Sulfurovum sp.]